MKIANALVCINCDTLFVGGKCPACCGGKFYPLRKWLSPLHSFEDIKEEYEKRNLLLQTKSERGVLSPGINFRNSITDSEKLRKLDEKFYSCNQGPAIKDCGTEPSATQTGQSNHPSGEQLESEFDFKSWCDRANANITKNFRVVSRLLKRGFEVPRKKHNCRVQNSKALSKDIALIENSVGKVQW